MTTANLRRACLGAVGIVAVFGAAELAMVLGGTDTAVFPLPSSVLAEAADLARASGFWSSIGWTMLAWTEAMAATIIIGVLGGLLLGMLPGVESAVRPVLEFLRPIPAVVLLPMAVLIIQNNQRTEVAVIVFASVWPVLINTVYGLRGVDSEAKETLRSFGFGPFAVARYVSVPSAAPFIATGIRIAASLAFVVAVAVELVGTGMSGVGAYVGQQGGINSVTVFIAAALWTGVVGLVLNGIFTGAERRAFRWHFEQSALEQA
ncbi:MAG: ABC transporter permease subunit [Streptosporangiaceae bacterium]